MSDIGGMRSDGGGMLGSDASLTPQISKILMNKLPLLNSPGSLIENSLYYDVNSSTISAVEMQETWGKDRIQLTSNDFNGSATGFIPSVLFCNTTFVKFVMKDLTWADGYDAGGGWEFDGDNRFFIPAGWGFWAIQDILLYMGASSIAQISLSGEANFLVQMACCETLSKRNYLWRQAGLLLNPVDPCSVMALPADGESVWRSRFTNTDIIAPGGWPFDPAGVAETEAVPASHWLRQAAVPLRLPYSSMIAIEKRLSLDAKLLTQPIQITLNIRPRQTFWDVTAGCIAGGVVPNGFESITYQMWQEELSDKSISVRNELLAMPEFNVGYPFQYAQTYPIQVPNQGANERGETSDSYRVNLTSIINADLTTFLLMVNWTNNTVGPQPLGMFNPLCGFRLFDVNLQLNGQRYFLFEDDDYTQVTMAKQMDLPILHTQYNFMPFSADAGWAGQNGVGTDEPKSQIVRSYYYEFNNSKLRAITGESHMQNTGRFTSQTWQLEFKVDKDCYFPQGVDGDDNGIPLADRKGFSVTIVYLYNGVFLIGGDGGTTKLVTN